MIKEKFQQKYALSDKGAHNMIQACISCTISNFVLMFPVGLIFCFVADLMKGQLCRQQLWMYSLGIIICLLLIAWTCYIQYNRTYYATYIESGVRRISIAEKLRKLPLSFFGKKDLADLTSIIMADCTSIETASSHFIPEFFGAVVSTVIIAIPLLVIDWRMGLASLWPLPVSLAIAVLSPMVIHKTGKRQMKAKMELADGIQECLESLRELKSENAEKEYLSGLETKINQVEHQALINELGAALFVVPSQMVLKFGIATTALVGGILLIDGSLDILTFFMYLLVVSRIYSPMAGSIVNLTAILMLDIPSQRINSILHGSIQAGTEKLTNLGYDISFQHVSFGYDSDKNGVLHNVSFTAHQGEVTALIGPSGSGKTTISKLAARFWDCASGKITVGGMDVSNIDPERLLSLFSIVFQDVILFNNSILENIRIGRKDASDEEVKEAAHLAHCDELVSRMSEGWNTMIGENGSELSGGERQRISIARAFLKNAPIILLDEATSALDVENESFVQQSLSRLIKDKTVSYHCSSHEDCCWSRQYCCPWRWYCPAGRISGKTN